MLSFLVSRISKLFNTITKYVFLISVLIIASLLLYIGFGAIFNYITIKDTLGLIVVFQIAILLYCKND